MGLSIREGERVPNPRRTRHRDLASVNVTGKLAAVYIGRKGDGFEERVGLHGSEDDASERHCPSCLDGNNMLIIEEPEHIRRVRAA